MNYVALLRGVNVGGNRKVPKMKLQQVFENLGFHDVVNYINSGNVVFASERVPKVREVESALEKYFGFAIPTLILPGAKIQAIAAAIPPTWTNDMPEPDRSGQKSDVLYLFETVNSPDILEKLRHKPEIETMLYVDGAVLANITRANQSRSSLLKIMGTPLYKQMTIRNITTARKLAELVAE